MKFESNTMGKLRKIKNGNVFEDGTVFVRELLQNSQRSRAKNVDFIIDNENGIFYCTDNGKGCANPESVFTLDLSEWDSTKEGYGIGFWSVLAIPGISKVVVRSRDWQCTVDVDQIFETNDLSVKREAIYPMKGFEVELHSSEFYNLADAIETLLFDTAKYLPMRVTINEMVVPRYDIIKDHITDDFSMDFDNRLFRARLEVSNSFFDKISIFYDNRKVQDYAGIDYVRGVIEIKTGKITLREPDRTNMTKDHLYYELIDKINQCCKELYKEFVKANGVERNESGIQCWLEVKDFEKYLEFDDAMLELSSGDDEEPDEEETVQDQEDAAPVMESAPEAVINPESFKKEPQTTYQTLTVKSAAKRESAVRSSAPVSGVKKELSFRDKIKKMKSSVWVSADEYDCYSDAIQDAKYKGLNVIVAKNKLYAATLRQHGITHIMELSDRFSECYMKENIELKNGKEEAFISLLVPIARKYKLPENVFLIADLSMQSQMIVDDKVVFKRTVKNKKNKVKIYGLADGHHIYLDRYALALNRFGLRKGNTMVGIHEIKAIMNSVNTIAHELSHFLYHTTDNTPEHYQKEVKLQQEIIRMFV